MDGKCNNCQRYATSLEDGGLCTPCARVFDSQSYRRIARILGIDAADREAVERRVKELLPSKGHDVADFYDESED